MFSIKKNATGGQAFSMPTLRPATAASTGFAPPVRGTKPLFGLIRPMRRWWMLRIKFEDLLMAAFDGQKLSHGFSGRMHFMVLYKIVEESKTQQKNSIVQTVG